MAVAGTLSMRHNEPRSRRIAISTTFGWNRLKNFTVWPDAVPEAAQVPVREQMGA